MTYRDPNGVLRLSQRVQGLFRLRGSRCPRDHRIHAADVWLDEDTFRCGHKGVEHTSPCNIMLYVLAQWQARSGEDLELFWAIEVTREEIAQMRQRRMTVDEKLTYLGCTWGELPPASTLCA